MQIENVSDHNVNCNLHNDVDRDDVEEKTKKMKNTSKKETDKYSHLNVDGYNVWRPNPTKNWTKNMYVYFIICQ